MSNNVPVPGDSLHGPMSKNPVPGKPFVKVLTQEELTRLNSNDMPNILFNFFLHSKIFGYIFKFHTPCISDH